MDDFLYKLRNAKNRSGYDRSRRTQDSYPYRTGDRKRPKGKKPPKMSGVSSDHLAAIRKTLETIVENQKQLMDAEGVRREIEERKALALETIARLVGNLKDLGLGSVSQKPAQFDPRPSFECNNIGSLSHPCVLPDGKTGRHTKSK